MTSTFLITGFSTTRPSVYATLSGIRLRFGDVSLSWDWDDAMEIVSEISRLHALSVRHASLEQFSESHLDTSHHKSRIE